MTTYATSREILAVEPAPPGSPESTVLEIVARGLPFSSFEAMQRSFRLTNQELTDAAGIPSRTLARRKREGRFTPGESDALSRVARILAHGLRVLEDSERVANWIRHPNRALGMARPLSLLSTDAGAEMVDTILGRIEYSVYS